MGIHLKFKHTALIYQLSLTIVEQYEISNFKAVHRAVTE